MVFGVLPGKDASRAGKCAITGSTGGGFSENQSARFLEKVHRNFFPHSTRVSRAGQGVGPKANSRNHPGPAWSGVHQSPLPKRTLFSANVEETQRHEDPHALLFRPAGGTHRIRTTRSCVRKGGWHRTDAGEEYGKLALPKQRGQAAPAADTMDKLNREASARDRGVVESSRQQNFQRSTQSSAKARPSASSNSRAAASSRSFSPSGTRRSSASSSRSGSSGRAAASRSSGGGHRR